MLKLKPPNGWSAVVWELVIVTVGVLIALAAQQWAEGRAWASRASVVTAAARDELKGHYRNAIEWRVVEPCINAQIELLRRRVLASGATLDPAPTYSEPGFESYVLRMPNREYVDDAWLAAIGDGVSSHLARDLRQELSAHYVQVRRVVAMNEQNNVAYQRLQSLSRPIPLDPMVRFSMLQELDELGGRVELMSLLSGQLIDHIIDVGMVASPELGRSQLAESGTFRHCRSRRLPTRSLREAMVPLPS